MRKLVAASLSVATLLVAGGYYTLFDAGTWVCHCR